MDVCGVIASFANVREIAALMATSKRISAAIVDALAGITYRGRFISGCYIYKYYKFAVLVGARSDEIDKSFVARMANTGPPSRVTTRYIRVESQREIQFIADAVRFNCAGFWRNIQYVRDEECDEIIRCCKRYGVRGWHGFNTFGYAVKMHVNRQRYANCASNELLSYIRGEETNERRLLIAAAFRGAGAPINPADWAQAIGSLDRFDMLRVNARAAFTKKFLANAADIEFGDCEPRGEPSLAFYISMWFMVMAPCVLILVLLLSAAMIIVYILAKA